MWVVGPYVVAARSAGRPGSSRTVSTPKSREAADLDPKAVRAWANADVLEVNSGGRLKAEIVEQYRPAGNQPAQPRDRGLPFAGNLGGGGHCAEGPSGA